jgi:DNA adenine methylase Dam
MAGTKSSKRVETREHKGVHERKCNICEQWLLIDKFYSNCKNNAYWIDSVCKPCRIAKQITRQKERKEEINILKRNKKIETRGFQSPFNYLANKYLLLPQIKPLFPSSINTFVDLFCGSATVGINTEASNIICNDIDENIINFYNICKNHSSDYIITKIKDVISLFNVDNEDSFKKLRDKFNNSAKDWDIFYVLVCHSFNQHPIYSKDGEFKTGWGQNLCHFNTMLEKRIDEFITRINNLNIKFVNNNFHDIDLSYLGDGDFLYADPPYLLSTATYKWSDDDEIKLLNILDELNLRGVKFALSNVLKHKNGLNNVLIKWSKKYKVHRLQRNYSRLSRGKQTDTYSTEVLITNY